MSKKIKNSKFLEDFIIKIIGIQKNSQRSDDIQPYSDPTNMFT